MLIYCETFLEDRFKIMQKLIYKNVDRGLSDDYQCINAFSDK